MGKNGSNGNGKAAPDNLEGLRATVTALQARLRTLDTERQAAQTELERVTVDRPELAAAAHARHEPGAADQLKALNTRALEYESAVLGLEHESAKVRAELAGAQAAFDEADRHRRLEQAEAQAAALARQIDAGLTLAAARWAEFQAVRDTLREAQRQRIICLKTVTQVLNEMAGEGTEGHSYPPFESMAAIDYLIERVTQPRAAVPV